MMNGTINKINLGLENCTLWRHWRKI